MAKTPEGKVKEEVTKLLKRFEPDLHFDMPVPSGFGKSGVDYNGTVRGYSFRVEAKAFGKRPTKKQDKYIRDFSKAGGYAFVITGRAKGDLQLPRGLQELEAWIRWVLTNCPAIQPEPFR